MSMELAVARTYLVVVITTQAMLSFTCINSKGQELLQYFFTEEATLEWRRLICWPRVTQLVIKRAWNWIQAVRFQNVCLSPLQPFPRSNNMALPGLAFSTKQIRRADVDIAQSTPKFHIFSQFTLWAVYMDLHQNERHFAENLLLHNCLKVTHY